MLTPVSAKDKVDLAAFLSSSAASLAMLQSTAGLAQDDGLRKLIDGAIAATEGQIKGCQEFCKSHNIG